MAVSIVIIVILLAALLLVIKLPSGQPKMTPEATFEFTNATRSSNSEDIKTDKDTIKKAAADTKNTTAKNNTYTIPTYTKKNGAVTSAATTAGPKTSPATSQADTMTITTVSMETGAAVTSPKPVAKKEISDTVLGELIRFMDGGMEKLLTFIKDSKNNEIREEFITEGIDYSVETYTDSNLPQGQERVDQEGSYGEKVTLYRITYSKGKEISRVLISSQITRDPVNRIVAVGGKQVTEAPTTTVTEPDPTTTVTEPDPTTIEEDSSSTKSEGTDQTTLPTEPEPDTSPDNN